ncbi:MAG: hypothetical protein J6Y25_02105 [Elusimicrobiaceae bacterium]|nr:hypothetical protein [Elusimicrobiaceae bacterium]
MKYILNWLKSHAGKASVSLVQAAGITAVVGAAGFAAYNYLSSPAENNSFMPPSVYENGNVVYVASGGGGGTYATNGAVQGSAENIRRSRALDLANQQAAQYQQQSALEDAPVNPAYAEDASSAQADRAYQLAGGNLGVGLGGGTDKDVNAPLQMLTGLQGQLEGMTDAVANATQAAAGQGGEAKAAPGQKGFATVEGSASGAANASRNWGQGRGSGGTGSSNEFVIQNSNKNGPSKADLDALAKAGDAMADARAAMASGLKEGSPMKFSGANFGPSDRLSRERDARVNGAQRLTGQGGTELARIRKHTAQIHGNKTNAANAGGLPFLAGAQINGGMVVDGSEVTIGNSSSSDVRSMSDTSLRGIRAGLASVQTNEADKRDAAKKELRSWLWTIFPAVMGMIVGIAILIKLAKGAVSPWAKAAFWIAAGIMTAVALASIIFLLTKIHKYADICGHDHWVVWGRIASGVLTVGVGAAWVMGTRAAKAAWKSLKWYQKAAVYLGAGGAGMAGYRMLADKDQYLKDIEEANKGTSDIKERVDQETNAEGGNDK